jgi:geranylgeranyl diphosphate synthase type I
MEDLLTFKKQFDILLKNYLNIKIKQISKFTKDPHLLDYIGYLKNNSLHGGKRIRPYLAYLAYQTFSDEENKNVMKLLVFLEIFHSFCLIHDDIIDKGNLRHGIPTSQAYIYSRLKEENRIGDLKHVSNSQAMLLGDILFSWAQELLNLSDDFNSKIMQKVKIYFYEMVDEVVVGQMIDADIVTRKNVSKELIDNKTRLKTAGYSFIKPLLIGAALSGNLNRNFETFCKEFGLTMGIAFQTQDDLLDITSSDQKLGKTSSLDKTQNQHTYFTYFPSLEYGKRIIKDNFGKARRLVDNLKVNKIYKQKFLNLIEIIEKRTF